MMSALGSIERNMKARLVNGDDPRLVIGILIETLDSFEVPVELQDSMLSSALGISPEIDAIIHEFLDS